MMDQGILKNILLTRSYQIPKNFPKKLKTIVEYIFRTENFVDISFETIPPFFKTDGTTVFAYHHVYIKHNKEPLVPQQKCDAPKLDTTLSCLIHRYSFMSKSNPTGPCQPYSKYYPRLCQNSP